MMCILITTLFQFMVSELPTSMSDKDDHQKNNVLGGYECNDDYTYIRGRGKELQLKMYVYVYTFSRMFLYACNAIREKK